MTTGLFNNRTGSGASLWHAQKRIEGQVRAKAQLDAFAEALSQTGDTTAAAKAIDCGPSFGRVLLSRLRRDLGPQAR